MMKTSASVGENRSAASGIEWRAGIEEVIPGRFRETSYGWLVMVVVWAAGACYLALRLHEGWVPYDGGALAEMAERTLRGQVPFKDFNEIYTGGLTYLNALAFRLFGTNFLSLRIPLFLFFLGWVPSVYFIARRFVGPVAAGAVTLLSVAWSVPSYPEAMASWYTLFFATWGVLALLRYIETGRQRWLWVAGLCAGLSFLIKIVALYFVAAALLFFVFREFCINRQSSGEPAPRGVLYRTLGSGGLLLFLVMFTGLVLQTLSLRDLFYFALPSACLVVLLFWELWQAPSLSSWVRLRRLFSMVLPFFGGAIAPVAALLAYYARADAFQAWVSGTWGTSLRIVWYAADPPSPLLAIVLVPMALVIVLAHDSHPKVMWWTGLAAATGCSVCLVLASRSLTVYTAIGLSVFALVPLLVLIAVIWLFRARRAVWSNQQGAFLLVAVAALCSVIQFPFAFPLYFNYVAPLAVLAVVGFLSGLGKSADRIALASLIGFYLVFAVWLRTPGFTTTNGFVPDQPYSLSRLDGPRGGGLLVNSAEAREYRELIPLVQEHAHGPYIYAGPDAPEVYFLTGLRNPTKTLFDFLDPDFLDVQERDDRILSTIRRHGVTVVALRVGQTKKEESSSGSQTAGRQKAECGKNLSVASGALSKGLLAALDSEFPKSKQVCNFDVRWK